MPDRQLARKTVTGFAKLTFGLMALLFVPAGTVDYWQAWLYLVVFLGSVTLISAWLWAHDPKLLARRISAGPGAETRQTQKWIMGLASLAFACGLIVPALDHRFSWSRVPVATVIAGQVLVALGFLIIVLVFRENSFAASTIGIEPDQQVITTGPYALVRHPMYAGGLVMLLGTPVALGSWWGLIPFFLVVAVLMWRILDEEALLSEKLPGYRGYCRLVCYRLIPYIW